MDIIIQHWDYAILISLITLLLFASAFAANKELKKPIIIYGSMALTAPLPIVLIPVYTAFLYAKSKLARPFIFLFLAAISAAGLNTCSSEIAKNVTMPELYSEKLTINEGDYLRIDGGFIKLHSSQYVVPEKYKIGDFDSTRYYFFYEIIPTTQDKAQQNRIFVSGLESFGKSLPDQNELTPGTAYAFIAPQKHVPTEVTSAVKASLKPDQSFIFIRMVSEKDFASEQKWALILSSIFAALTLTFLYLAYRKHRLNKKDSESVTNLVSDIA